MIIQLRSILKHRILVQFMKYMVGGGVYFWGGLIIFAICFNGLGWGWFPSKILADIVGWSANYMIQRYWAFIDDRLKGQDRRVLFKYIFINGIALLFDYGIVGGLYSLGISPYVGFFVSSGLTTIWDYLWYRFWVFKPSRV